MKPFSLILFALGLLAGWQRAASPGAGTVRVKVTAKEYAFDPAVIRVKKGSQAVLEISSLDVQHGFQVPGLRINQTIQKGRTTVVTFQAPDKPQEFTMQYNVVCGPGHDDMEGRIVVE